jgi:purine-binding chemotaxis protein CheW
MQWVHAPLSLAQNHSTHLSAAIATEPLSFRLGREEYGIPILKVQEIRGFEPPTRMVTAHRHVLGVLNLRGTIVPILDMRLAYGLEPAYGGETVSIVLNIDQHVVGLVVDAVSDVVALTEQEIRPAPQVAGSVDGASVVLSR